MKKKILQNRVDPFGQLIKTPERGLWLGNRGVIHNDQQEIVRPFKLKAWITCELSFRGRHREIMQPNRWTELFFLDEATSLAAGHRPCFQCRYKDHQRFKQFWLKGNQRYGFNMKTPISEIDSIIHSERISADKSKIIYGGNIKGLPDGAFIVYNEKPYLIKNGKMYRWTPGGYLPGEILPSTITTAIITPRSVINTLTAGYIAQMSV